MEFEKAVLVGTGIESEVELSVQLVEELLRSPPLVRVGSKHRPIHLVPPSFCKCPSAALWVPNSFQYSMTLMGSARSLA